MELAYKYRIYPNKQQRILIAKTFGCSRFVYNYFLNCQNTSAKHLTYSEMSKNLTVLKKQLIWLSEVDSTALQSSLKDLDTAFSNRFKNPDKFGQPNFKSKRNSHQSYKTKNNNSSIQFLGKHG